MCGVVTRKYKEKDQDDDLAKAFQYFDEDGMGKISLKNLRKVTRELGENITDEQLEAMIDEFDKDGDGASEGSKFFHSAFTYASLNLPLICFYATSSNLTQNTACQ